MNNVIIERFWRSLKYESVHPHAFKTGSDRRPVITYYSTGRPHSGLAGRPPVEAYQRIWQSDHERHDDNRD